MGSKGGGSGSSTVTQQNQPPAAFMNAYTGLVNNAQATAAKPYQPYTGQMVADFNPTQNQAFGSIEGSANMAQPFINQAQGIFQNNANTNLWGQVPQINAGDIAQYESPYTKDVTQATEAQFANLNAQQQSGLIGNAINSGAFGGDRAAVAQGILGGQQAAQEAPVLAGIQQQGYNTALQTAQQQQGAQLGALEAQGWLGSQSAFGLGQLGGESQNLAESGAQGILGVGNMQQQLSQQQLNVPFYQYQAGQAYPFQTQSWLANIVEGAGAQAGGTGTTQTNLPNQSNGGSQIFGDALSAAAVAAMFMDKGGRIPYRARGGILPPGIPIMRRGPGGGIFDYAPGGGGSTGIFDYAPDMGMAGPGHGAGPPPAPRSVPAYQQGGDQSPLSQIMPLLGLKGRKGGASSSPGRGGQSGADGFGGFMGSGVSDSDMAGLSMDAMENVGAGAAGLRHGGILRRGGGGGLSGLDWAGIGLGAMGLADGIGSILGESHSGWGNAEGGRVGYDDGGAVDDDDLVTPDVGRGSVPLRYVQDSPYQDPEWTPDRGGMTRNAPLADDPRVTDPGNYALEGGFPDEAKPPPQRSDSILPPAAQPAPPAQKDSPYGYEGYQAPNRASSGIAPWKLGLLGAGLGILERGTKQHPLAGATEGLRAYAQAQGAQDRQADIEAQRADESAYRKANLKREGEQFSTNVDLSKQKLKQAGAQNDARMQLENEKLAQTGAHQGAMEGIERSKLPIEQQRADAATQQATETAAWRRAEAGRGLWEPSAPIMGDDGKPKTDTTGAPLYTWTDRYTGNTRQGPYDPASAGRGAGRGSSASQWKYNAWLSAHPNDEQGALDFVGGHKQMGEADITKAAHTMAQGDYKTLYGSGDRPPPQDVDAWLSDRAAQYAGQLRASRQPPAQQQQPAMQPYPPMNQRVAGKTTWTAPSGAKYRWNGSGWDEAQ
jgi:hypothetical protein